jgi:hypothetical protein
MLTNSNLYYSYNINVPGSAIAFVINEDVVDTIPTYKNFADSVLLNNPVITSEIENSKEILIFNVNGKITKLLTGERLTAILLSNPLIVEIDNSNRAVEPGWKYINNKFIKPIELEIKESIIT